MSKQTLREEAVTIRNSFAGADIRKYSELITSKVITVLQTNSHTSIHVYVSRRAEPRTIELIKWLLVNDYVVYVPVLHGEKMYCKDVSTDTIQGIFDNPLGLGDSTACEHNADIDMVIVPTLCFDSAGNRLGYGKGFYDRFLAGHPTAVTIGLCYEANKDNAIPAEPHDVRLKTVITEADTYDFFDKTGNQ